MQPISGQAAGPTLGMPSADLLGVLRGSHVCPRNLLLRQSIKQAAGSHAAPLLTRINVDGGSPQADGQILTKNIKNEQIHVNKIRERLLCRNTKMWAAN